MTKPPTRVTKIPVIVVRARKAIAPLQPNATYHAFFCAEPNRLSGQPGIMSVWVGGAWRNFSRALLEPCNPVWLERFPRITPGAPDQDNTPNPHQDEAEAA